MLNKKRLRKLHIDLIAIWRTFRRNLTVHARAGRGYKTCCYLQSTIPVASRVSKLCVMREIHETKNTVPEQLQFDVTLAVVSFFLNYRPENRANHIAPQNYNVQQEVHCDTVVCDKDTMRKNYCVV